ncbi:MAG: YdcF family protein [Clostridia bacterium]|nr:YdcF family protein [Clostridia bacterium]
MKKNSKSKLSQTPKDSLRSLTSEQKSEIVFGNYSDCGLNAEIALLLGSNPDRMPERIRAAAKLYFEGRIKYIIATGGVEWDVRGETISESNYMAKMLSDFGVPKDAIVIENEAKTTRENMICSLLSMQRTLGLAHIKRVIIVTSPDHLRRSMALGRWIIPRNIDVVGFAAGSDKTSREHWQDTEESIAIIDNEIRLLRGLVNENNMDDIEY